MSNFKVFVSNYTCDGNETVVREARKSFVSGHSSFSFYCATFLIIYLQTRLSHHPKTVKLLCHFLYVTLNIHYHIIAKLIDEYVPWANIIILGTSCSPNYDHVGIFQVSNLNLQALCFRLLVKPHPVRFLKKLSLEIFVFPSNPMFSNLYFLYYFFKFVGHCFG